MSEDSQVRAFYKGKNFFITGGTGFVGLCLIEKILRCIPDSGKLYLLMRPKKGKDISERLQEFPKNPVRLGDSVRHAYCIVTYLE